MTTPSNFASEIETARNRIKHRIADAMQVILKEEIEKTLGRVKIRITSDLTGEFSWYIESEDTK